MKNNNTSFVIFIRFYYHVLVVRKYPDQIYNCFITRTLNFLFEKLITCHKNMQNGMIIALLIRDRVHVLLPCTYPCCSID